MKSHPRSALLALLLAASALALDFPLLKPPREMFRRHREQFLGRLAPNAVAILHAAPERVFSNDVNYVYRQDSSFYYLTGVEEPGAIALFRANAPDGKRYVLFLRPRDARREAYEGPFLTAEGATAEYAADAAFSLSEFEGNLLRVEAPGRPPAGYLAGVDTLYLSGGGDEDWAEKFRSRLDRLRAADSGPMTTIDPREILHELRLVKDGDEIALIKRAAEITARGHVLAMKAAAPGAYEFEVQQALDSYCLGNGARRMAYPSIVGSGPDSIFLHWEKNDRQMREGEVVVNDSGAEYASYASDVTRTYPVSGRFSAEQKRVYEAVLAAQKGTMAIVKPGVLHEEIEKLSARLQTEGLVRLGLLSGDVEKLVSESAYRKFTVHGISHWVGLDVHDVGRYRVGGSSRKLVPGMVLTIEPGIYIPANTAGVDPKWWNIGVRIEDTVLVTPTGYDCLSCAAPKEVEDVEKAVQKK
jgi:Xaa-Pro aminopeptidase